jgi:hypothetical protein
MAKLSKANNYAILWLNYKGNSPEQIAEELSIDVKQVSGVLEKQTQASENPNIKTSSSVVGDKKKNLMIMETSVKRNKSVAIMTKDASAQGDENRKKVSDKNTNKNIFKPRS